MLYKASSAAPSHVQHTFSATAHLRSSARPPPLLRAAVIVPLLKKKVYVLGLVVGDTRHT